MSTAPAPMPPAIAVAPPVPPPVTTIIPQPVPTPATPMNSLKLGDGTVIHYNSSQVQDPIPHSFLNDIATIARLWDDTRPEWNPGSTDMVKINCHTIALRYWPQIYKHSGTERWKGFKDRWTKWKVRLFFCLLRHSCLLPFTVSGRILLSSRRSSFLGGFY